MNKIGKVIMKKRGYLVTILLVICALSACANTKGSEQELKSTEPVTQENTWESDLNHDGESEIISVFTEKRKDDNSVILSVEQNGVTLLEQEVPCNYALGEQYYLVKQDGEDYLMRYKPLVDHDMASCDYEVFCISPSGEKEVLDEASIEVSLYDAAEINKDAWKTFAEKENIYFADASLVVSTLEGEYLSGNVNKPQGYVETFSWLLSQHKEGLSLEENLNAFIEENKEYAGTMRIRQRISLVVLHLARQQSFWRDLAAREPSLFSRVISRQAVIQTRMDSAFTPQMLWQRT